MAGTVADDLIARMGKSVHPGVRKLNDFVRGRPAARKLMAEVKSIEGRVAEGHHPLHAAYCMAQNYLSVFAELASSLRPFKDFTAIVSAAEQAYRPGWPPISPVSVSFFTSWAFLDLPLGASGETMCDCARAVGGAFGMADGFAATLEAMGRSTMGIYQHLGWQGDLLRLRDILNGQEYHRIVPSGYRGAAGELWYGRLLQPLNTTFGYRVAFTSPYVLRDTNSLEWLAFFARHKAIQPTAEALLKRGPDPNYWNQYVYLAYHAACSGAIDLCGIPDRPLTLPHAHRRRASVNSPVRSVC
jgi:hypothetical protein